MGFVISLIQGKQKNVELRILPRDLVEFILFPNIEMSYRMNLKQEYTHGVEKMDTNAWEVDLINEKTRNLAQKLKDKMNQNQKKKQKQQFVEENMQAEMEQKQLRKIISKISGLKNKLNERQKQIEVQKKEMQKLKLRKDKIQLQVDIMTQMIRQEEEKYQAFRNFDFTYVTKSYKLVDAKKQAQKKFVSASPQTQKRNQLSLSISKPQYTSQNLQISSIKLDQVRARESSKYFQQYVQEDATPRRGQFKRKAQSPLSTLAPKQELIL